MTDIRNLIKFAGAVRQDDLRLDLINGNLSFESTLLHLITLQTKRNLKECETTLFKKLMGSPACTPEYLWKLGKCYEMGFGTPINVQTAIELYMMSTQLGNTGVAPYSLCQIFTRFDMDTSIYEKLVISNDYVCEIRKFYETLYNI